MAKVSPVKQAVEPSAATTTPETVARSAATEINLEEAIAPDIDIESMIADQLLDSVNWSKVRSAIIRKAPAKLFAWLTSGNNTPINISAFPELTALPSSDDEGKAA
ncbi:hypothetical protein H6F44_20585 [Pseudanabaena sp. FACHB-1277]|uniref:Uncharacterized protein n=1 Tax=Pseudanabaena cinerea FACHB-1277 TaxID=2949581 RepID=A0A926Z868_9CYAN|nr:hypothetical protein [Pseudanabaena cinerea]MBD2152495.1 hypothetical protein [Pseudanabaena cinerea FACHB-1277]